MSRGDEITGSGQLGNGTWANVSFFSINKGNHLPEGEFESSIIKFQTQWQPSLIHHENQYTAWPAWSCVLTQVLVLGQWEHYLSLVGADVGADGVCHLRTCPWMLCLLSSLVQDSVLQLFWDQRGLAVLPFCHTPAPLSEGQAACIWLRFPTSIWLQSFEMFSLEVTALLGRPLQGFAKWSLELSY